MILTKQQRFLLDALEILGGARIDQLAALLRPVFYSDKPDIVQSVTENALRQMYFLNNRMEQDGELVFLPQRRPGHLLLEAVDVMLEIAGNNPVTDYRHGKPPILLRFSVQEQKVRLFTVTTAGANLYGVELPPTERIILLFDGQGIAQSLPVSNKQFFAVRQNDGHHRFFAVHNKHEGGY